MHRIARQSALRRSPVEDGVHLLNRRSLCPGGESDCAAAVGCALGQPALLIRSCAFQGELPASPAALLCPLAPLGHSVVCFKPSLWKTRQTRSQAAGTRVPVLRPGHCVTLCWSLLSAPSQVEEESGFPRGSSASGVVTLRHLCGRWDPGVSPRWPEGGRSDGSGCPRWGCIPVRAACPPPLPPSYLLSHGEGSRLGQDSTVERT